MKISSLLQIGLINTLRFNLKYFGVSNLLRPKVLVGRNVKLSCLEGSVWAQTDKIGGVKIGINECGIFDKKYERTIWRNKGKVCFYGHLTLGQGVRIDNHGSLYFGNDTSITANSTIICYESVRIGDNCIISWDCLIMDTDFHKITFLNSDYDSTIQAPIEIGNHVWIGCRCLILKGAFIPANCVVGAASTVTKSFEKSNILICNNEIKRESIMWQL